MLRQVLKRLPVIISLAAGIVWWTLELWPLALGDLVPSEPIPLLLSATPPTLLVADLAAWLLAIWDVRNHSYAFRANLKQCIRRALDGKRPD